MKSSKNKIFTTAINSIYVLSVIYFILSIAIQYRRGFSYTEQKFSELTRITTQNLRTNPEGSKAFSDMFLSSLEPINDIQSIQLICNDKLLATYPVKNSRGASSSLIKSYNTSLTDAKGQKILLKANLYILKPSTIYNTACITFVIVLLCTLACAAYLFVTRNDAEPSAEDSIDSNDSSFDENAGESSTAEDVIIPQEEVVTKDEVTEAQGTDNGETQSQINEEAADVKADEEKTIEATAEEEAPLPSEKIITGVTAIDTDTKTGFGSQDSLLPHLDSELVKASSASQDLSLLEIKIEDIGYEDSYTPAITSLIKETARYSDCVFEYADTNYILILKDTDVDKAMLLAQNLYKKLYSIINSQGTKHHIFMGLSSKSIRLLTGSRILNETDQALIRATQDRTNPIVAFRVNPSKYKDYINNED